MAAKKNMTKRQTLDEIAAEASKSLTGDNEEFTRHEIEVVLDAMTDIIHREVKAGRAVTIPNLARFRRSDRKRRKGRNPQTGEPIMIPAKKVPKITPLKPFKELLG